MSVNEVRRLRSAAGLSQSELAGRVGMSQPNISAYESGARIPSGDTLSRIRAAYRPLPRELLIRNRREILRIAAEHKAHDVRVFGSVARGEDRASSDIDFLVRFDADASLLDLVALADALEDALGIAVDVVSEAGLTDRSRSIRDDAVAV